MSGMMVEKVFQKKVSERCFGAEKIVEEENSREKDKKGK
jgi:hypothetical protein